MILSNTEKEELIDAVKQIIFELYEACYCGGINIEKMEDGYKLTLYLNKNQFLPTASYIQCNSKEEFLNKIRIDLHNRKLNLAKYFVGYQIDLNDYIKKRNQRVPNSEV